MQAGTHPTHSPVFRLKLAPFARHTCVSSRGSVRCRKGPIGQRIPASAWRASWLSGHGIARLNTASTMVEYGSERKVVGRSFGGHAKHRVRVLFAAR